jgi:pilus assembly protein Flp/PilA
MQNDPNEIRGLNRVQGRVQSILGGFVRCDKGATSIEYGLICSLIFLAIVASVQGVGTATNGLHTKISTSLQ